MSADLEPVQGGPDLLRGALSGFPAGVVAIAALVDTGAGEPTPEVLVASSFSVGVSHDPPLVMFAVQRTSTTWPDLRRAPRLGVSVLGEAQLGTARDLAMRPRGQRLADVRVEVSEHGAVFLPDAPVRLECSVEAEHPAGDHHVVLLRVHRLAADPEHRPIVLHRSQLRVVA